MRGARWLAVYALAAALVACGGEEADPGGSATVETTRPEIRRVPITAGGAAQPVTLRLYRSPEGFPLPFTTYVPQEMRVATVTSGEGDGVRFLADSIGVEGDTAMVHVFFYPESSTESDAREVVRTAAESYGPIREFAEVDPTNRYPWSIVEYRIDGGGIDDVNGTAALGRHAGRFFHVIVQIPATAGESFAEQARTILEEWRWEDTGGGLGR
jgi:hypothetical protein